MGNLPEELDAMFFLTLLVHPSREEKLQSDL